MLLIFKQTLLHKMDFNLIAQTKPSSHTAAAAKSLQSCPTLWDSIDGSPPGSLSLGFSRQEHWSGLPLPSPAHEREVAQLCPTLRDPMDCSPPGSSVHGIFQARVLEWVAIAFSRACYSCLQSEFVSKLRTMLLSEEGGVGETQIWITTEVLTSEVSKT